MPEFRGNGLPVATRTGQFPPAARDDARRFAAGAKAIAAHQFMGRISAAAPRRFSRPASTPSSRSALHANGIPILPALTDQGRDAVARDVQDACGGRTDGQGRYAYRAGLRCLDSRAHRRHSPRIGWARDGFPIYGSRGKDGRTLRSRDLDACHGHTHVIRFRGRAVRKYHYHLTSDFPYVVGCFRGRPTAWTEPATEAPPVAPAPPALTTLDVTTTPAAMYPGFDRGVSDYVVRCEPNSAVVVHVGGAGRHHGLGRWRSRRQRYLRDLAPRERGTVVRVHGDRRRDDDIPSCAMPAVGLRRVEFEAFGATAGGMVRDDAVGHARRAPPALRGDLRYGGRSRVVDARVRRAPRRRAACRTGTSPGPDGTEAGSPPIPTRRTKSVVSTDRWFGSSPPWERPRTPTICRCCRMATRCWSHIGRATESISAPGAAQLPPPSSTARSRRWTLQVSWSGLGTQRTTSPSPRPDTGTRTI